MPVGSRSLYLCGGPQSSGSTLISWCFLQRRDMDGYLDADNDVLAEIPALKTPFVWYKTTISGFRMTEMMEHFQDEGCNVRPLLICRDVRAIYASLSKKHYGRNGTTAEDPPLRLRLRRFKKDWEVFRLENWPILCYEKFLADPEGTLRAVCVQLGLPWDDGMLSWPKRREEIANTRHGNGTFHSNRGQGLRASLKRSEKPFDVHSISAPELAWLEEEFGEYNRVNGYPLHVDDGKMQRLDQGRAIPSFERTRRHKWTLQQKPLRWVLFKLGLGRPFKKSA